MRWKDKPTHDFEALSAPTRVVRVFLWLPTYLPDETRWLEWAWINQEYVYVPECRGMSGGSTGGYWEWEDVSWAKEETKP